MIRELKEKRKGYLNNMLKLKNAIDDANIELNYYDLLHNENLDVNGHVQNAGHMQVPGHVTHVSQLSHSSQGSNVRNQNIQKMNPKRKDSNSLSKNYKKRGSEFSSKFAPALTTRVSVFIYL